VSMVDWSSQVTQSASCSSHNRSKCYPEACAQSMQGFGLAPHTLDMFAAPAHTIHLQVRCRPCVNGRLVIEGRSKRFVLLAQSIQVLSRGMRTIDAGLWTRSTRLGHVCNSSAHDSSPSEEQAVCQWSIGHRRSLKALRALSTIDTSAIPRHVHNRCRALDSQHTPWTCLQLQRTRFISK